MLSPAEWGQTPYEFLGTYRLEADKSFTCLEGEADLDDPQEKRYKALLDHVPY